MNSKTRNPEPCFDSSLSERSSSVSGSASFESLFGSLIGILARGFFRLAGRLATRLSAGARLLRARRRVDSGAVLVDDRVVFTSEDGRVRILSLADGEEIWSYDVGKPISASPAVASGHVVIGVSDGRVYAFGPKQEGDSEAKATHDDEGGANPR